MFQLRRADPQKQTWYLDPREQSSKISRVVQTRSRVGGVATTGVAKKGDTLFAALSRMSSLTGRRGGPERDSRRGTVSSAEMPNDPGTAAGDADTDAAAADVL